MPSDAGWPPLAATWASVAGPSGAPPLDGTNNRYLLSGVHANAFHLLWSPHGEWRTSSRGSPPAAEMLPNTPLKFEARSDTRYATRLLSGDTASPVTPAFINSVSWRVVRSKRVRGFWPPP